MSFQKYKQTTNKNTAHTVQMAFRKGGRWRGERRKWGLVGQSTSSKHCAALEINQPLSSLAVKCWGRRNGSSHSEHTWSWPQTVDSHNQQKAPWLRDSIAERLKRDWQALLTTATTALCCAAVSLFMCLPFVFCETNGTSGQKGKGHRRSYHSSLGRRNPPGIGTLSNYFLKVSTGSQSCVSWVLMENILKCILTACWKRG